MINPGEMKLIQILITNKCNMKCTHCSQMCPHQHDTFFMPLKEIEHALETLVDYPGHVGLFGGEPTLHPKFKEVLALLRKYVPVKARRELWTNGAHWAKYKGEIEKTFYKELIAYNEHEDTQPCWHQPNQIAAQEVFSGQVTGDCKKDEALMWKVIDNCWVQNRWSAAITPMGGYFCEVAAARAHVLGGPRGITIRKGWWKEPLQTYSILKDTLCADCSMCLPMLMQANDKQGYDDVSAKMAQTLNKVGSPAAKDGKVKPFNVSMLQQFYQCREFEPETEYTKRGGFKDFPEWTPWIYRSFEDKKHEPKNDKRRSNKSDKE